MMRSRVASDRSHGRRALLWRKMMRSRVSSDRSHGRRALLWRKMMRSRVSSDSSHGRKALPSDLQQEICVRRRLNPSSLTEPLELRSCDRQQASVIVITRSRVGPCEDVIREIIERISSQKGILCCAAVCKQWRCIVMDNLHRLPHNLPLSYCLPRQQHLLPLLMHFDDDEVIGNIKYQSILDNKSFTDYLVPEMITDKWIVGSSNGCLLLTELLGDKDEKEIHVLNLLPRARVSLPSFFNFTIRDYHKHCTSSELDEIVFIRRAIVVSEDTDNSSSRRNLQGCVVIAIISAARALSFCRPGDVRWTTIEACRRNVSDVIYFKGQLYAVICDGELLRFDDVEQHQRPTTVAGFEGRYYEYGRKYLVESTFGNLLLVVRCMDLSHLPYKFLVYKLKKEKEEDGTGRTRVLHRYRQNRRAHQTVAYGWVKVKSLGDQILFIGQNCKSVRASLYPPLKGNRIYFTDADVYYEHAIAARLKLGYDGESNLGHRGKIEKYDMGIYDMEENRIQPIGGSMGGDKLFRVPPVWVEPIPWLTE